MHFESGVGHIGGNLSCIDILPSSISTLIMFNLEPSIGLG